VRVTCLPGPCYSVCQPADSIYLDPEETARVTAGTVLAGTFQPSFCSFDNSDPVRRIDCELVSSGHDRRCSPFGLLVPQLNLISSMNKWLLPAASTGICLVFLVSAF